MKTLKNLIILSCFLLSALFYVSCSKDKTGTEITLSYYAGDWYGKSKDSSEEKRIITIHTDGSITDNNNESGEITLSHYAGNWYGKSKDSSKEERIITIHDDGSITDYNNQKINPSDITRNSATNYTLQDESKLNFSSATKGTFTPQGIDAIEITKK